MMLVDAEGNANLHSVEDRNESRALAVKEFSSGDAASRASRAFLQIKHGLPEAPGRALRPEEVVVALGRDFSDIQVTGDSGEQMLYFRKHLCAQRCLRRPQHPNIQSPHSKEVLARKFARGFAVRQLIEPRTPVLSQVLVQIMARPRVAGQLSDPVQCDGVTRAVRGRHMCLVS